MIDPQKILSDLLGEATSITLLGREIDLLGEVVIPSETDLDDVLYGHPIRVAAWKRIAAKCRRKVDIARDELEQLRADRFRQYWKSLEEQERAEMLETLHDEDTEDRDTFRRKIVTRRVTAGPPKVVPRWRRNFTDDLVWGYVNGDDAVITARATLRSTKNQLEIAEAVCTTLDHRARCISHLCARQRE